MSVVRRNGNYDCTNSINDFVYPRSCILFVIRLLYSHCLIINQIPTTFQQLPGKAVQLRLIATWTCILSAVLPSLAACWAASRVQTVHDGPPVLVRRRSILPAGPNHVVFWCNRQRWSQIGCIQHSRSATNNVIARRPVIRCGRLAPAHGTDCHHRFVALIQLLFLNDNWRHFYSIVLLTDTTLLGALLVLWHLCRPNLDVF